MGQFVMNLDSGMREGACGIRLHRSGTGAVVCEVRATGTGWTVCTATQESSLKSEAGGTGWPATAEAVLGTLSATDRVDLKTCVQALEAWPGSGSATFGARHHLGSQSIDDAVTPAAADWQGIADDAATGGTTWDARCSSTLAGLANMDAAARASLAAVIVAAEAW